MKRFFYLMFIVLNIYIVFFKNSSIAEPSSARSPLSYAKAILDHKYKNAFINDLGENCYKALKKHYRKGKNLYCHSLAQKAVPLHYFTENSDIYLYHYSKSEIALNIFQSQGTVNEKMNNFFQFFRNRDENNSAPYVATDPHSSKQFGKYLLKFKIDSNSNVLLNCNKEAISKCKSEISEDFHKFSENCRISFDHSHANKLALMILEDSGIALNDYYSDFYNHHKECSNTLNQSWLQLTGPEWILDVDSFNLNETMHIQNTK